MGSDHRTTSPGIGDGIKNPLRRAARVQRVDPLIPVGWPVRDEAEAQEVWSFLSEEIEHRWNGSIPDPLVEDDGTLRPTLIGLWSEGRLIGGAFVRPAIEEAAGFAANGWENAAQVVRERVCVTEAIAVRRECRGKGIGLRIKGYCDAWAREHHALLMLSIPTNDGARHLNEKAGHTVLDTDVSMVLQFTCDGKPVTGGVTFHREQTEGYSAWAFKVLAKTHGAALRVGQCPHPAAEASTEDYNSIIRLDGAGPGRQRCPVTSSDVHSGLLPRTAAGSRPPPFHRRMRHHRRRTPSAAQVSDGPAVLAGDVGHQIFTIVPPRPNPDVKIPDTLGWCGARHTG